MYVSRADEFTRFLRSRIAFVGVFLTVTNGGSYMRSRTEMWTEPRRSLTDISELDLFERVVSEYRWTARRDSRLETTPSRWRVRVPCVGADVQSKEVVSPFVGRAVASQTCNLQLVHPPGSEEGSHAARRKTCV